MRGSASSLAPALNSFLCFLCVFRIAYEYDKYSIVIHDAMWFYYFNIHFWIVAFNEMLIRTKFIRTINSILCMCVCVYDDMVCVCGSSNHKNRLVCLLMLIVHLSSLESVDGPTIHNDNSEEYRPGIKSNTNLSINAVIRFCIGSININSINEIVYVVNDTLKINSARTMRAVWKCTNRNHTNNFIYYWRNDGGESEREIEEVEEQETKRLRSYFFKYLT